MSTNMVVKSQMNQHDLQMLGMEMSKRQKSKGIMFLLWFFFGGIGAHRYYLGKIGSGIAMTLTLGGLGIWTLIDLFLMWGMCDRVNEAIEMNCIKEITITRHQVGSAN